MNNFEELSKIIANHSVSIVEGDNVLIELIGCDSTDLGLELQKVIQEKNANVYFNIIDYKILAQTIKELNKEQVKLWAENDALRMKKMDVYIGITSPIYPSILSNISSEKLSMYNTYYVKPVHLDIRAKMDRWCILKYPNESMASHFNMQYEEFKEMYLKACSYDFKEELNDMEKLIDIMNKTDIVNIKSEDTDLTFSIKGMKTQKYDGRFNLPDGEVATAPVIDSANGYIKFTGKSSYNGQIFNDIYLEFKNGKVVKAFEKTGKTIDDILDIDKGARYIGEFAFGFNPYVDKMYNDIMFDEKIKGSIHLALGECFEQGGNDNKSAIHWDIVKLMNTSELEGKIYFDNKLVYENGKLLL